jgi:hypothetical protein
MRYSDGFPSSPNKNQFFPDQKKAGMKKSGQTAHQPFFMLIYEPKAHSALC